MTPIFKLGDRVQVLNAIRLPKVIQVRGEGVIHKITTTPAGTTLYWIDGFACGHSDYVLRPAPPREA